MPDLLPSSLPDTNLVEILWENGKIVMQPHHDHHDHDTDVPWYPTDDYCNEFLSEFTGNTTTNSPLHDAADKAAATTADHTTVSNPKLQTQRTQDPATASGFLKVSNFTRPVALRKAILQNDAEGLKPPHKSSTTSLIEETAPTSQEDQASVKWDEKNIINSSSKERRVSECLPGQGSNLPEERSSEMIAASSSSLNMCSGNGVAFSSTVQTKHKIKRTIPEGDESWYQSEDLDDESAGAKKPVTRPRSSNKRSRAAEVHNLSERRRRDRINEKMRALQELIPNCNKVDKASMLDEAIEYLKTLQFQVQMMSTMGNGGGGGMYMPHFPQMGVGMRMFDVNASPMMHVPHPHYPCSSIPVSRYHPNGVSVLGHPVPSVAHGSPYSPLLVHSTAGEAARMNFGPQLGDNTSEMMLPKNPKTGHKIVDS